MNNVQSRCGLCCDTCEYKVSAGCKGCIASAGFPFWGECNAAKCCMKKGHAHCGECKNLPSLISADMRTYDATMCNEIYGMSIGDGLDEHNDTPPGKRIDQCREWATQGAKIGE